MAEQLRSMIYDPKVGVHPPSASMSLRSLVDSQAAPLVARSTRAIRINESRSSDACVASIKSNSVSEAIYRLMCLTTVSSFGETTKTIRTVKFATFGPNPLLGILPILLQGRQSACPPQGSGVWAINSLFRFPNITVFLF